MEREWLPIESILSFRNLFNVLIIPQINAQKMKIPCTVTRNVISSLKIIIVLGIATDSSMIKDVLPYEGWFLLCLASGISSLVLWVHLF